MDIIHACESLGHALSKQGNNIRAENIQTMPEDMLQELRQNKAEILTRLDRDNKMKKVGAVIGIPGKVYFWTLSRGTTLYLEQAGGQWLLYRMNHYTTTTYTSVRARGRTFDHVYQEAKSYMAYLSKERI